MKTVVATPFMVARRAAFLRAFAVAPRPEEPSGVGAVVRAGNGDIYTVPKVTALTKRWANAFGMTNHARYRWEDLPRPIEILSHGVQVVPEETP